MNRLKWLIILLAVSALSAGHAQTPSLLEHYDLSNTVINPERAPTYEVYSWWADSSKNENEPIDDIWLARSEPLGFRGTNFQRFYIHIDTVYKISSKVYRVEARSRCKDEFCHIKGQIVIDSVKPYVDWYAEDLFLENIAKGGTIYAHYEMRASSASKAVARLFGLSTYYYLIHQDNIYYDATDADGYMNNQYTGKWVSLVSDDTLTCNWGDYKIPESRDLDRGCGEFIPDEKYYDYGWKPYIDMERHAGIDDPEHQHYMDLYKADEEWWSPAVQSGHSAISR